MLGLRSILGSAALFYPVSGRNTTEPCRAAEQLLVQVSFDGPPTRYGLELRGYPAITDEASLPEPVDIEARDTWQRPARLSGAGDTDRRWRQLRERSRARAGHDVRRHAAPT